MCGRYNIRTRRPAVEKLLQAKAQGVIDGLFERYNVAPTQPVAAVRNGDDGRELVPLRWGLVPSWSKDTKIASKLINARSETVAEKPSFRTAFKRRRCLIPASGYYEWQGPVGRKQPYHIDRPDGQLIVFAGLWERWQLEGAEPLDTCTILTTSANQTLSEIHNRMPVILPESAFDTWMDPATPAGALQELLAPAPEDLLDATPISTLVNNARVDSPDILK